MLLFLAHVSPSFLRELPPVEISKDHPSEKSKVWLEPESATTTSVWQAEDWGALWQAEGLLRNTVLRGWGPGGAGGGPATSGASHAIG